MKYILKQLLVLVVVGSVALLAATVSARQVTNPPPLTSNFDGNTSTPVNTGVDPDIKGGGLTVGAFVAEQNASFLKRVDLEGILTGGVDASTNSALSFGDPKQVKSDLDTDITRIVDLAVTGSVYAEAGALYSKEKGATAQLCADPNGVIVLCTTPVKYGTVRIARTSSESPDHSIFNLTLTGYSLTLGSDTVGASYQVPVGTYTMSATCSADPTLTYLSRDFTYPRLKSMIPVSGSTLSVLEGQTVTVTGECTCVREIPNPTMPSAPGICLPK